MKNINLNQFAMLLLLAVGSSCDLTARHSNELPSDHMHRRHEDGTFIGRMHKIQNELKAVRLDERKFSKEESFAKLDMIKGEISELAADQSYNNEDTSMHDTHIRTLRRELKNTKQSVKRNGR